jgi:hypothetical protein
MYMDIVITVGSVDMWRKRGITPYVEQFPVFERNTARCGISQVKVYPQGSVEKNRFLPVENLLSPVSRSPVDYGGKLCLDSPFYQQVKPTFHPHFPGFIHRKSAVIHSFSRRCA